MNLAVIKLHRTCPRYAEMNRLMNFSRNNDDDASSKRQHNNLILGESCLQRSGCFEFCGLHPRVLYTTSNDEVKLFQTLEQGGYISVLEALQNQRDLDGRTPPNQPRNIVLKCLDDSVNYQTFTEALRQGIALLHNRYRRGKDELHDFRMFCKKGDVCIRKLFSPCYDDTIENTLSCLEHLGRREAVMPCNVCIEGLEKGINPVELIWSEPNQFESLFNLQWPRGKSLHSGFLIVPIKLTVFTVV